MKKMLVLFLFTGVLAFAGNTKPKKSVKKVESSKAWTCTVGNVTISSNISSDPCAAARRIWCDHNPCQGTY